MNLFAPAPPMVNPVKVPTLVIAVWAAPVTVAAVPDTLPVTFPASAPVKVAAVTPAVTAKEPKVPTLVKDDPVTVDLIVVPGRVSALNVVLL